MKKLLLILFSLSFISLAYSALPGTYYKTKKIELGLRSIKEELGEPEKLDYGSEDPANPFSQPESASYTWDRVGKITFHFSKGDGGCNRIDLIPAHSMSPTEVLNFAAYMYGLDNRTKVQLVEFKFKKKKSREVCLTAKPLPRAGFDTIPINARVYYDGKKLIISSGMFQELKKRLEETGDTIEEIF